jgi:hypothetical protein
MSGNSNVGNAKVHEAGDQRNEPESKQEAQFGEEGQKNSHLANDSSRLIFSYGF